MSGRDSPYRRPAPESRASTRARPVASRPETPEERDQREAQELADARKKRFRAQSAAVGEELSRAKLFFGIQMRLAGAALLGLSVLGIASHASHIAGGATSIWVSRLGPLGLFLGPFLLVAGAGGAASKDSVPMWWRVAVVVALGIGMYAGTDFEIDLAIFIADTFM